MSLLYLEKSKVGKFILENESRALTLVKVLFILDQCCGQGLSQGSQQLIIRSRNNTHILSCHTSHKKSSVGKIHSLTGGSYPGNGIQPVEEC